MSALLQAAQARADAIGQLLKAGIGHLSEERFQRGLSLAEEALERIQRAALLYGPDEVVLDRLVGVLTVAVEACKQGRDAEQGARAQDLLQRALARRMATLR